MLRILLIAGGFLTLTAGLLYFQPRMGPAAGDFTTAARAPESRATAGSTSATVPATVPQVQVSRAQSGVDLTGTGSPALNNDPLGNAVARAIAPVPAADSDLKNLTAGVLANLGAAPPAVDPGLDQTGDLRSLTSTVLASLNAATGAQAATAQPQSLENLVVQALQQGQSDSYIDTLLQEAYQDGKIQAPQALIRENGTVDTLTLLASLVQQSQPRAAAPKSPQIIAGGDGVEVRVVQRAGKAVQYNFYTVQPGDSLGAIAKKFYGDAGQYNIIFNANRQFLSSPDRIRVGQRLSIPSGSSA